MSKSRAKGTAWESACALFLDERLPVSIERRTMAGANDRGDLAGVPDAIFECKNHRALELGEWMTEAEREADRDGGSLPIVLHKRRGKGNPGESFATMPIWALAELLKAWLPA